MGLILLEAAGALAILIFIVWWTMFSGRKGGELPADAADQPLALVTPKLSEAAGASDEPDKLEPAVGSPLPTGRSRSSH